MLTLTLKHNGPRARLVHSQRAAQNRIEELFAATTKLCWRWMDEQDGRPSD